MFWIDVSWNQLEPWRRSLDLCFINALRLSTWAIEIAGRREIGGFSILRRSAECTRRPNLQATSIVCSLIRVSRWQHHGTYIMKWNKVSPCKKINICLVTILFPKKSKTSAVLTFWTIPLNVCLIDPPMKKRSIRITSYLTSVALNFFGKQSVIRTVTFKERRVN